MIKQCPVLINNSAVTVVSYGKIEIQFPSIHKDVDAVYVDYKDGKYFIVDKAAESVPQRKKNTNRIVIEDNIAGDAIDNKSESE